MRGLLRTKNLGMTFGGLVALFAAACSSDAIGTGEDDVGVDDTASCEARGGEVKTTSPLNIRTCTGPDESGALVHKTPATENCRKIKTLHAGAVVKYDGASDGEWVKIRVDGLGAVDGFSEQELSDIWAHAGYLRCDTGGGPVSGSTFKGPGCETHGSITACTSTLTLYQDFRVEKGGDGHQTYSSVPDPERIMTHPTVTVTNGAGLKLTFMHDAQNGKGVMGSRLYQAELGGHALLYNNWNGDKGFARVQSNWGQGGFPVFGGVESAFPVEEHGYYGNLEWESELVFGDDGSARMVAKTKGVNSEEVTVTTILEPNARSWRQRVDVKANPGTEVMYYTNVMVPAGRHDRAEDIEVLLPGVTKAQVHSRGGGDGWLPGDGGWFDWPNHAGHPVSHVNTEVKDWLGLFTESPLPRYGFFNHSRGEGLVVIAEPGKATHPKFFCGNGITAGASSTGNSYCEMWFSPNARSFWDHPTLANGTLSEEVRIAPIFSPGELSSPSF